MHRPAARAGAKAAGRLPYLAGPVAKSDIVSGSPTGTETA
jgi:hypothetical protein